MQAFRPQKTLQTRSFGTQIQNLKPAPLMKDVLTKIPFVQTVIPTDPQEVHQYADSINDYLKINDKNIQYYMDDQPDITEEMRAILMDWLIGVHLKFQLRKETLYLCRHLIDNFLSQNITERSQLQLVGITSLFIASKYEEIYPPQLKDFIKITDYAYSVPEVIRMEGIIMNFFNFDLFFVSPLQYLDKYCKKIQMDEKNYHLAWYQCLFRYLIDLSIVDYKSIQFDVHTLVAGAIYLVNKIRLKQNWTIQHEKLTGLSDSSVRPCAKYLCTLIQGAEITNLQQVQKKFATTEHFQVSKLRLERNQ